MKTTEVVFDDVLGAWVSVPRTRKRYRVKVSDGVTEFETVKFEYSAASAARAAEEEFVWEPVYVTVKLEG